MISFTKKDLSLCNWINLIFVDRKKRPIFDTAMQRRGIFHFIVGPVGRAASPLKNPVDSPASGATLPHSPNERGLSGSLNFM